MKRTLSFAIALAATAVVVAQNIAVVSPSNNTTVYQTLDDAIINATDGSIVYLPGGGFQISDDTRIDKQLTIMGVSHRGDTDNADGATVIAGRLNFVGGSSGSAVIGIYLSGNIDVGEDNDSVVNFTVRKCNVNSIQVHNSKSSGMVVNQCYLRQASNFLDINARIENNVMHSVQRIKGGTVSNNVVTGFIHWNSGPWGRDNNYAAIKDTHGSTIMNNFILTDQNPHNGDNCLILNNCHGTASWGDDAKVLPEDTTWDDVFKSNKGVSIMSDFHLTDTWANSVDPDLTGIGIYGGDGFSDVALAPIPRIVSKKVAEQTDGSGKLKIEIKVKAQ